MKDSIRSKFIRELLRLSRLQRRILLAFAGLVVALTTYALMTPAITIEGEYLCGKDAHVHSVSCYQKNEDGTLTPICGKEEHVHDERCIVRNKNPERYVCGHDYEHTHDESCYRDGVLICTLKEHTHGFDCLAPAYKGGGSANALDLSGLPTELEEEPEITAASLEPPPEEEITAAALETPGEPGAPGEAALTQETPQDGEEPEITAASVEGAGAAPSSQETAENTGNTAAPDRDALSERTRRRLEILEQRRDEITAAAGSYEYISLTDSDYYDGVAISFTITKDNKVIDPALLSGDGYRFDLAFDGAWLDPQSYHIVSYYELDVGNCNLYFNGQLLEEYATGNAIETYPHSASGVPDASFDWKSVDPTNNNVKYRVIKRGPGRYYFEFVNCINNTVPDFSLYGELTSLRDATNLNVVKDNPKPVWNTDSLAYEYTITSVIPHAVDDYSRHYYLVDQTTLNAVGTRTEGETVPPYSGFVGNAQNGSFVVKLDGNPIRSITDIRTGDPDRFAYYLDSSTGQLHLLNYTQHSGSHQAAGQSSVWTSKNFCSCWQQTEDMTLTITYLDLWGRPRVLDYSYTNMVNIYNGKTGATGDLMTAFDETLGSNKRDLLTKTYDANAHTYTIVFNKEKDDYGGHEYLYLTDTLDSKLRLVGTPTISYKLAETDEALPLPGDRGWCSASGNSFTVTLHYPQPYIYYITYTVEKAQASLSDDIAIENTVDIRIDLNDSTGIQRKTNDQFGGTGGGGSANEISYKLTLYKEYMYGNPERGATFEVRYADTDAVRAISRIVDADDGSLVRRAGYYRGSRLRDATDKDIPYLEGDFIDEVWFGDPTLETNKVFYLVESEAPEGFEPNTKRYYFYIMDPRTPQPLPDGYSASDVIVFDQSYWHIVNGVWYFEYTFPEKLVNVKYLYSFPETGSSAGLLLRTTGVMLMLSPALYLLLRKRGQKRVDSSPRPEFH